MCTIATCTLNILFAYCSHGSSFVVTRYAAVVSFSTDVVVFVPCKRRQRKLVVNNSKEMHRELASAHRSHNRATETTTLSGGRFLAKRKTGRERKTGKEMRV